MPRGPVDANFLFTLGELSRLVRAYADRQAARYGITRAQWAVLAKLHEVGPTSQNQLGRMTAMDVATIKGVVDRLRQRGLIGTHPDPADTRRRLVVLTRSGRALAEARFAAALAISEETLAPLTEPERKIFQKLLAKLR